MYSVMRKDRLSTAALKAVLNKYLQGTASEKEVEEIEAWYESFQEQDITQDTERLRAQIVSGIMDRINMGEVPARRRNYGWLRIAAIFAGAVATGLFFFNRTSQLPVTKKEAQLVSTVAGSRKTIHLSDGTVIHLNAGTQLSIPDDYGISTRQVSLSGEAFFEVAPDAQHPFIIHADSVVTTVLGTSFNIRAYPGQEEWQIAVTSGKVKVASETLSRTMADSLTANKALSFNRQTSGFTINDINTAMAGAWRNNIFYFSNSTIAEIGEELERQYNIPVTVTGEGKNKGHYQISFSREPLSKVMKVLAGLTGITYTLKEDKVIIYTQKPN